MNDTQIIENLDWALDAIDDGDMGTAVDYIRRVRDHFQEKEDAANEAILDAAHSDYDHEAHVKKHLDAIDATGFADARDHHLIRQDLHRAVGKK